MAERGAHARAKPCAYRAAYTVDAVADGGPDAGALLYRAAYGRTDVRDAYAVLGPDARAEHAGALVRADGLADSGAFTFAEHGGADAGALWDSLAFKD